MWSLKKYSEQGNRAGDKLIFMSNEGGWKQFPVLPKTYSLMHHYNHSNWLMPKSWYQQTAQSSQVAVNSVAQ